ncbi:carboxylate--amine ligase [Halorussus marinus]|uniref:carboxylate--amine ligase n=1 Tax=Halorussus marinus TaxID=2505976 RepID=UPI00106EA7A4|nr:carboxylate--amine ligase [Halorussus marinus]
MATTENRNAVLLPTGYDPATYACLRSLSDRGLRVIVASHHDDVPEFASRFCDEALTIPSPHDDLLAYKDALVGIAARPDVRTVVPIREEDSYVLTKYREEFEAYVSLLVPDLETLRNVHDRKRLFEIAAQAGLAVPETRLLSEVDDWSEEMIVKSRYNLLTDEYLDAYAPDEAEEVKTVTHLRPGERPDSEALVAQMHHEPLVQEYVESSDEYLFGAVCDRGELLSTFQHRQIRGNSYTGGGGVYRESVDVPALERAGRTLLEALDWHGVACIEYMRDAETGEFVLTEINPRMYQSLPLTVRAGADFPLHYWLAATDRPDRVESGYEVGAGSHLLYGELGYLLSVLRDDSPHVERPSLAATAWEILSSCYDHPNFDYLRLDDPGPFVQGVRHMLSARG